MQPKLIPLLLQDAKHYAQYEVIVFDSIWRARASQAFTLAEADNLTGGHAGGIEKGETY